MREPTQDSGLSASISSSYPRSIWSSRTRPSQVGGGGSRMIPSSRSWPSSSRRTVGRVALSLETENGVQALTSIPVSHYSLPPLPVAVPQLDVGFACPDLPLQALGSPWPSYSWY